MRGLVDRFRTLPYRRPATCMLINDRTGGAVATTLMAAKNAFQHGLGLIGRHLPPRTAMVFLMPRRQRFSPHMWFVFRPIDVLFCDRAGKSLKVVSVKRRFKPFTTHTAPRQADIFIELPADGARHVEEGDTLTPKDI